MRKRIIITSGTLILVFASVVRVHSKESGRRLPTMKTSTRRTIGAALVVVSLCVGVILCLSGTLPVSLKESHMDSSRNVVVIYVVYVMHWPFVVLLAATMIGVLLFVIPGREKRNSLRQSGV